MDEVDQVEALERDEQVVVQMEVEVEAEFLEVVVVESAAVDLVVVESAAVDLVVVESAVVGAVRDQAGRYHKMHNGLLNSRMLNQMHQDLHCTPR